MLAACSWWAGAEATGQSGAAAAAVRPNGDYSLTDQGWRVVEQDGKRLIEMQVLLTNKGRAPLVYEIRFLVECQPAQPAGRQAGPSTRKSEPEWAVVGMVPVKGGPLGPGKSEVVKATVPYALLQPGEASRFEVQLLKPGSDNVLAAVVLTAAKGSAAAAALVAAKVIAAAGAAVAVGRAAGGDGGGEAPPPGPSTLSGSGTMTGQHESQRVGDEWTETGSGDIDVTSAQGHLVLHYTYEAHGPDAGSLAASATATGTFSPASGGATETVTISSATAQISRNGDRQQDGQVVTRTGCQATGTFSGTVGSRAWSGLLTMTDGAMTLDLSSNMGTHQFNIQFTAS
jgi:hypothetical protein